jgi:CRP-like cAMP-binding protein
MFSSIASSGITTHYQAGTEFIQKFMPNTGVHVVCAGAVALSEIVAPQNNLMLDVVLAGGLLGIVEYSLDLRRYHFSARALSDSVVTFFPRNDVRRLCADHAGEMEVLAAVSRSFRQLERRYVLLGTAEASDRLIATLLWLSGMDKTASDHTAAIPFELTNATLSSLIGSRPETVTRLMNQFRAEGLVGSSGGRMVITDLNGLKGRSSLDLDRILIDPMMS